ncbi:MAG: hypothetical protein J6I31_00800 [Prevotella sp.]|nr:hypothetical protein [Prevotella sp.]
MKKLFALLMLMLPLTAAAQDVNLDEARAKMAFVEKFYGEWEEQEEGISDYAFIKRHTTKNAQQQLKDNFDYDCDGECFAGWMFYYEGGGDTMGLTSTTFSIADENHINVNFKYEGYEYEVQLTVVKSGDTYKIDGLKQLKSIYTN